MKTSNNMLTQLGVGVGVGESWGAMTPPDFYNFTPPS